MNEAEALARMIPPGKPRPGKYRQGVIQILVTSQCDKACFNCTQGSQLVRKPNFMTPEHFEQACESLAGYWGVVGVFGGNPALHPEFEALCDILCKYFPSEQRGLWCNHPITPAKAQAMRRTFDPTVSNLNCHLDQKAYAMFKQHWPESLPFGRNRESRHSPPYVAIKDVVPDESERWELISKCEINKGWSALLGVFRGQLRAWFCEIAGAQSIIHQDDPDYPDTGWSLQQPFVDVDGKPLLWWQLPMGCFAHQVRRHCHSCGVPLQGFGELAQSADGKEQVSVTHAGVYRPKRAGRRVELVTVREQLGPPLENMTRYLANSLR